MTTSYPQLWGVAYSFWVTTQTVAGKKLKVMDRRGGIGGNNAAWFHIFDGNHTIIIFSNTDATDLIELRDKIAAVM